MRVASKIRLFGAILLFLPALSIGQPQQPADSSAQPPVMIAAVSREDVLAGGIGFGRTDKGGRLFVEPIARLSPDGTWKFTGCDADRQKGCERFNREYLTKPHTFEVVSADGNGAKVSVPTMKLDGECLDYGGLGAATGPPIRHTAVAAESAEFFAPGDSAKRLPEAEAEPVRRALAVTAGNRLDATRHLKIYRVMLERQEFFFAQRAYQDYAPDPKEDTGMDHLKFIFAAGRMKDGRFELLHWKENTEDDNEHILGLIHLKSGRDFLVTSTSDPETQHFRVYGIRKGQLAIVFEGGGGGC